MLTQGEREKAGSELQLQERDDVEANISLSEKAVGLPPSGLLALNYEALLLRRSAHDDYGSEGECECVVRSVGDSDGILTSFGHPWRRQCWEPVFARRALPFS
jgi:hypothetical protein